MKNWLELTVLDRENRPEQLGFVCQSLYNAGYAGKNQAQVRGHIEELAKVGVPAPTTTPTLYPLSNYLLTTSDEVQVQHGETSGEIEYAFMMQDGKAYITVASDQTDRKLENFSVPESKQACPDVIAPVVWPYEDIKDHWNKLRLRCWVTKAGERTLYQDDTLAALMDPEDWRPILKELNLDTRNFLYVSGTINTLGGLIYGDSYELELFDPVLERSIRHSYAVKVLPEGIE